MRGVGRTSAWRRHVGVAGERLGTGCAQVVLAVADGEAKHLAAVGGDPGGDLDQASASDFQDGNDLENR